MKIRLPLSSFYPADSPFRAEEIEVREPTIADEDRLFNPDRIKGGYALDDFIKGLLSPELQKEYRNMFLLDRNFIIYAVRVAMYGDTIELREPVTCPHCDEEVRTASVDCEIFIPENLNFELREGSYRIKFKLLTVADQMVMAKDPLMKNHPLTRTLFYVIDEIENKTAASTEDKFALIRQIPLSLSGRIKSFLSESYPRLDLFMLCPSCGGKLSFDLSESFFWNR